MRRAASISIIFLCVQLSLPQICFSQNISELVQKARTYIMKEDFDSLTFLYLLPSHLSVSEINEEKEGIKNALRLLSNEFGSITNLAPEKGSVQWLNLEIFGGDLDFVNANPNFTQFIFKANFSKLGKGFIVIRVYEDKGSPKLRSVGYALPDLTPNRSIINRIGRKLMALNVRG